MRYLVLSAGIVIAALCAAVLIFPVGRPQPGAGEDAAPSAVLRPGAPAAAVNAGETSLSIEHLDPTEPLARPMGDIPTPAPESAVVVNRATPRDLLAGLFDARKRSDTAWLARAVVSVAQKPVLDELDLRRAARWFLWTSAAAGWDRVAAAFDAGQVTFTEDGASARAALPLDADRALTQSEIPFVRTAEGWFLDLPWPGLGRE